MKKIAKGVTLLLITLFLLMTTTTICAVAKEEGSEFNTSQANFTIENSLDRDSIKIYVENNVLYFENQSAKELGKVHIKITINGESFDETSEKISGFSTYSLKLTNYFSEEYINGKDVNINVIMNTHYISICILLVVLIVAIIVFFIIFFIWILKKPKQETKNAVR